MKTRLLTPIALTAVLLSLTAMPARATEPSVSINDVTIQEPSYGTKTGEFTISLDAPTDHDVTVGFYSNAQSPQVLYAPFSGSRTISAGETTASIPFTVAYTESTSDYTFTVAVGPATGATISDATGVATVLHTIPAGSFVCQAIEYTGATGTGRTAGSPDGVCRWWSVQWEDGGGIGTDSSRAGPPVASAWVTERNASYLIPTPGAVPTYLETWIAIDAARSRVSVRCGDDDSVSSDVAGLRFYVRGQNVLVLGSGDTSEYRSISVANGWRVQLNLTEYVGTGDVRFSRQTAVRVTSPTGAITNIAVAEVGPKGEPCI